MTLFTTLVFHTQVQELHLKPVRIKVEERPYTPRTRDAKQVKW